MKDKEIQEQLNQKTPIELKYMMGTTAHHTLGEISRTEEDLLVATHETPDYYIGNWVTGFGLIDVLFPKSKCRELTAKEIEFYKTQSVQIGNNPPVNLETK